MVWHSISAPWRHTPSGCPALATLGTPAERAGVREYLDLRRLGG